MSQQIAVQVTGKDGKLTESFEDNLQITKTSVPAPQDGEVLVRVLYRYVKLEYLRRSLVLLFRMMERFVHCCGNIM